MDYKILVPIDFSEVTENALKYAIDTAKIIGTGITLLHLVETESEKVVVEDKLNQLIYKYEGTGVNFRPLAKVGDFLTEIGITAEEEGCGVIFMGTHGMKGLQKVFGSRALKVITNSTIPFIITQDKIRQDDRIDDLVVPIDMGKEDKQILTSVIRSAHIFKAKVHLFVNKRKDEFHENSVARNLSFSKKYLEDHDVNFTVSHTNGMDSFEKELIRFSQDLGADMIAIVNHHEGALAGLLGSNFDQNVITNEAKIPVMIVNSKDLTKVGDIFQVFS